MFPNSKGTRYVRALLIAVLIVLLVLRYAIQQYFRNDGRVVDASNRVVLHL